MKRHKSQSEKTRDVIKSSGLHTCIADGGFKKITLILIKGDIKPKMDERGGMNYDGVSNNEM